MTTHTVITERLAALETITLDRGSHDTWESGHCAMEVLAWLAGEGITDAPECASPVLRTYTIGLNDKWDQAQRQLLVPYLPRMVGTADDGQDEARSYMAMDWLVRTYTPTWLDLAGLTDEAASLRDLHRIVDRTTLEAATAEARHVHTRADAARDAAEAAAKDAAGAAAWAAAGAAAWAAAGAAAGGSAAAAAAALRPTVQALQESALDLLDRMIDPAQVAR